MTVLYGSAIGELAAAHDAALDGGAMPAGTLREQPADAFTRFLGDPAVTEVAGGRAMSDPTADPSAPVGGGGHLLDPGAIRLDEWARGRFEAVGRCGRVLAETGAVEPSYVEAMLEREHDSSTYIGDGVAIPHGTDAGKNAVRRDALAVLKFPEPVDWDGFPVTVCIAIAARSGSHVEILGRLAEILLDRDRATELREAEAPEDVFRLLMPCGDVA